MIDGVDDASPAGAQGPPPAGPGVAYAATPPPGLSAWQRIIGIFVSPVETLRDVARRPDIIIPLVLLIVISLACTAVAMQHIDLAGDLRAGMEQNGGKLSAEQMDRTLSWTVAFAKATAWASPILLPFWWAVYAGIVLLAFRLFGADVTYPQAYSIKIYSVFPSVLRGIVTAIVLSTRGKVPGRQMATVVRSNLGFLTDLKDHPVLFTFLANLDIFALWTMVLAVIGYACAANVSRARAAGVVVTLMLLGVLFSVAFAAIGAGMKKA